MKHENVNNEVFILGGENYVSLKEYISIVAGAVWSSYPKNQITFWPMYILSAIIELFVFLSGMSRQYFADEQDFIKNNRAFNIEKALNRLGYQPKVSLQEGMKRTAEWYKQNGYLD